MLTWTEIETRAYAFQKRWKDTAGDERQNGQTIKNDLIEVFGMDLLGVTDTTCTKSINKKPRDSAERRVKWR